MSKWHDLAMDEKVHAILAGVPWPTLGAGEPHHLGRPFTSAYQIAIAMQRLHPETVAEIGHPLGGKGAERETSLSQYIARELSGRIKADPAGYPIEGAFLSNRDVAEIQFRAAPNQTFSSSLTDSGIPMSIFRARD